ncbi:polysaccharide biosynthesis protein [Microbacterium sp. dk485]|uniref:oligosaccharide flippase family protein n=1 Tax=Microbacterium sp. dk485 TaxID=2560021 RepID=UPI001073D858|nr:oligosaccharide flippase family protein [Microbacterium sp. dk485]TFV84079.1 polysaccharide biosynthesis protein [Microbacterium sp. dk485]
MSVVPKEDHTARRAKAGVAWIAAQTWVAKAGGFLTLIVLARLLTPSDFGFVAIAMTILPLVYLIADLGFGTYLMQLGELDETTASTAFWYSAASGTVLAAALAATAPLLEILFGAPGVAVVILGVTPAILLVALSAVPVAVLRRGLRFRALAVQSVVAALLAQAVAIALALAGAGVWALICQTYVAQAVILVAAWISSRWRPRWAFRWRTLSAMVRFGTKVVAVNVVSSARLWAESAVIANVLGAAALGRLSIAQRLVQTMQEVATSAIAPISTVVFAQVRDDPERLRRGYARALGLAYVVITPALTALAVLSPLLVPLLFGAQWQESARAAQALAIAAIFTLGAVLDHGLFYGLGRPGRWLVYAAVVDALTVAATIVAVSSGIVAVAIGFAIVAAAATIARWLLVARAIGASPWTVARPLAGAVVMAAGSGAAGWLVLVLLSGLPALVSVAAGGAAIALVHVLLARIIAPAAFAEVFLLLRRRATARFPRGGSAAHAPDRSVEEGASP